ncbi:MAG TPA: hypothetical protein VJV78_07230 [Polyangiales bacterium]|nr:hypothetical protein [Polyangiales bacterium]
MRGLQQGSPAVGMVDPGTNSMAQPTSTAETGPSGMRMLAANGGTSGVQSSGSGAIIASSQVYGAWTAYPFFKSGIVLLQTMESGLFVLMPQRSAWTTTPAQTS